MMIFKALSCLKVYLPCCKAKGHELRTCLAVQEGCWHKGHEGDTFMFYLAKLVGMIPCVVPQQYGR